MTESEKLEQASLEDLEKELNDLQVEADTLKARRMAVKAVFDRKLNEEKAKTRLAGMSKDELDAVVRVATLSLGSEQVKIDSPE